MTLIAEHETPRGEIKLVVNQPHGFQIHVSTPEGWRVIFRSRTLPQARERFDKLLAQKQRPVRGPRPKRAAKLTGRILRQDTTARGEIRLIAKNSHYFVIQSRSAVSGQWHPIGKATTRPAKLEIRYDALLAMKNRPTRRLKKIVTMFEEGTPRGLVRLQRRGPIFFVEICEQSHWHEISRHGSLPPAKRRFDHALRWAACNP